MLSPLVVKPALLFHRDRVGRRAIAEIPVHLVAAIGIDHAPARRRKSGRGTSTHRRIADPGGRARAGDSKAGVIVRHDAAIDRYAVGAAACLGNEDADVTVTAYDAVAHGPVDRAGRHVAAKPDALVDAFVHPDALDRDFD